MWIRVLVRHFLYTECIHQSISLNKPYVVAETFSNVQNKTMEDETVYIYVVYIGYTVANIWLHMDKS